MSLVQPLALFATYPGALTFSVAYTARSFLDRFRWTIRHVCAPGLTLESNSCSLFEHHLQGTRCHAIMAIE